MNDLFLYYARSNRQINEAMNETLGKNLPDPWGLPLDGYHFRTLGAILEHLFVADMNWMKAFLDLESYGMDLAGEVREIPAYGTPVFSGFEEYRVFRARLDGFIEGYMGRVDDALGAKAVSRKTRDGQVLERGAFRALVHFFNHQTHHRGQISNILDNLKIENNYSNMIFLE